MNKQKAYKKMLEKMISNVNNEKFDTTEQLYNEMRKELTTIYPTEKVRDKISQ